MKQKKIYIRYFLLFLLFLFSLIFFFNVSRGDTYVNYGFSYAISIGEIPYTDFNLVIPPFAPWFYSLFFLFSKSILVYYIGQAFLLTIFFYLLSKMLDKKIWIYLILLFIPFPIAMVSVLFPGYNFLLLFLFGLLLFCEKQEKSDLLVGLLLGLAFMTKQTVGGLLVLPSLFFLFKDYKKVLKRMLGFFIPVVIGYFILFLNGSFMSFIDLCFLGLFDFGSSNVHIDYFYLFVFLLSMLILIVRIIKKPKNLNNYYVLLFASCVYPILDYYHVSLFLAAFFIVVLMDLSFSRDLFRHSYLFALSLGLIWMVVQYLSFSGLKVVSYPNFPFSLVSKQYEKVVALLDDFTRSQNKDVVYFLRGSENYFYKIKGNQKITYFDLPNRGNYGYDGTKKLIDRVEKLKDTYIIIDQKCYQDTNSEQQYIKEAVSYIMEHGKKIKVIQNYVVYWKE